MQQFPEYIKETSENMSLNMDDKIQIKNLCEWKVGFRRLDGVGDIIINPNGFVKVPRGEVYSQVQSGNNMFTGTDGLGSHARIYIDDTDTRVDLEFEDPENKRVQLVVDDNKIKELFAIKAKTAFEKAVRETVITNAEKARLAHSVKKFKLNELDKAQFIEEYTGMSVN